MSNSQQPLADISSYKNPLTDTLSNIHAVNSALQNFLSNSSREEQNLNTEAAYGVGLIFDCVLNALQFEIEQRPESR